jgi:hypothetical protein
VLERVKERYAQLKLPPREVNSKESVMNKLLDVGLTEDQATNVIQFMKPITQSELLQLEYMKAIEKAFKESDYETLMVYQDIALWRLSRKQAFSHIPGTK